MKHLRQIRKTFVRQLGPHDCGVACICMILKYAGKETDAAHLRAKLIAHDFSLLDLRDIAVRNGLSARCVTMDLDYLRTMTKPCILHMRGQTGGGHFQVCYGTGSRKGNRFYLMGDPARGIHYVAEQALMEQWLSQAALYFDDLTERPARQTRSTWHRLLSPSLIPRGLLVSIPLLSAFTAILGIAWSWALQHGIYDSMAGKENRLIAGVILLLFIVTLARNLLAFIRQQLMIRLNTSVNRHLMVNLIRKLGDRPNSIHDQYYYRKGVADLMKMQQGVSAFIATLLSEGSIVVMVISALTYRSAGTGLINITYLILITLYTIRTFPELNFEHAHLNGLSGAAEKMITVNREAAPPDRLFLFHEAQHTRYLDFARKVSSSISKHSLVQECLGTVNVICVFTQGIFSLRNESMDYNTFIVSVILSYFVTALMPKICSSLFVVSEAIEASRDHPLDGNF